MAYIARDDRPEDKAARYAEVAEEIMAVLEGEPNRTARMATVASMLHDAFKTFFWTGFYVVDPAKRDELVVGHLQSRNLKPIQFPGQLHQCQVAVLPDSIQDSRNLGL